MADVFGTVRVLHPYVELMATGIGVKLPWSALLLHTGHSTCHIRVIIEVPDGGVNDRNLHQSVAQGKNTDVVLVVRVKLVNERSILFRRVVVIELEFTIRAHPKINGVRRRSQARPTNQSISFHC